MPCGHLLVTSRAHRSHANVTRACSPGQCPPELDKGLERLRMARRRLARVPFDHGTRLSRWTPGLALSCRTPRGSGRFLPKIFSEIAVVRKPAIPALPEIVLGIP